VAEVFYSLASALRNEANADYTLLYSRVAEFLRPGLTDARLLTAELLETLGRYELATEAYRQIPADNPSFHAAELGRSEALRQSGKTEAAIEVLEQLARTHGDLPVVHTALGDLLRQEKDFAGAVAAYDRALNLYDEAEERQWFIYYARGISYERMGDWPRAEADFRAALELSPEQPQVLNYLGYTMVEKKIKLDEALDMIERAVAARPDSGYIVDSLGWVLFRLGRFEEAVEPMERATELMPVDPVVNDHLGDVYWAVGRQLEAEFQWRRALSFVDEETAEEAKPDRIRRKLEVGLDVVLQEEGAPPLQVANDG
jgi:Flp pilus assembly protein TadD